MFRKTVIILTVFSPLLFTLFIGYPIISQERLVQKQIQMPGVSFSKRCFAVGDFREFKNCFASSDRLAGSEFFAEVFEKTDSLSPVITVIFLVALLVFVYMSALVLFSA